MFKYYFSLVFVACFMLISCSDNTDAAKKAPAKEIEKEETHSHNHNYDETAHSNTANEEELNSAKKISDISAAELYACPDQSRYFILNDDGNEVRVINTKTNESKLILSQDGLKNNINWNRDCSSIIYKYKENYQPKFAVVDLDGNKTDLTKDYPPLTSLASLKYSDTLFYLDDKTLEINAKHHGKIWQIGEKNTQYYNLLVSPNGKYLAANKGSDIVLIDLTNNTMKTIGKGIHTDWHSSSNYLIGFLDESQDGHQISNADIYLYDIVDTKSIRLTETAHIFEAYPSFSDNYTIIYNDLNHSGLYTQNIRKHIQ